MTTPPTTSSFIKDGDFAFSGEDLKQCSLDREPGDAEPKALTVLAELLEERLKQSQLSSYSRRQLSL